MVGEIEELMSARNAMDVYSRIKVVVEDAYKQGIWLLYDTPTLKKGAIERMVMMDLMKKLELIQGIACAAKEDLKK